MSMSMTYIQLIQQCTLAIWSGGVTLNFYQWLPVLSYNSNQLQHRYPHNTLSSGHPAYLRELI